MGLLALSAALALRRETTVPVVVVAADLPSGHVLTAADLDVVDLPDHLAPRGRAEDVDRLVGSRLSGGIGAGEAITQARLTRLRRDAVETDDSRVVPVDGTDPALLTVLRPGDLVDIVSPPETDAAQTPALAPAPAAAAPGAPVPPGVTPASPVTPGADVLAAGAVVVEVTAAESGVGGRQTRAVLVRLPAAAAAAVAARSLDSRVALTAHG